MEDYLVTAEVATYLRVPAGTLGFWRHAGKGPRYSKMGRRVVYARSDVEAFVQECRRNSTATS